MFAAIMLYPMGMLLPVRVSTQLSFCYFAHATLRESQWVSQAVLLGKVMRVQPHWLLAALLHTPSVLLMWVFSDITFHCKCNSLIIAVFAKLKMK